MNLVDRAKNILITPKTEWEVIKNEQTTTADLFTKYAMILALIPALAGFIGLSLIGISLGPFGSFRYPISNGLLYLILYFFLSLGGIYLLALIIDALAPSFGSTKDLSSSLKIAVYSYTAHLIVGILMIFYSSTMLVLTIILSLYSVFLLYLGLKILKGVSEDKLLGYTVVIGIIMMIIYFFIFKIVSEIALPSFGSFGFGN